MSETYLVRSGLETTEITDDLARDQWDMTPEELRTGEREGSFILWSQDARGWRVGPIIFRLQRESR